MRKIGGRGLFEIEEEGRKRWMGGIGDGRERSMGRRGGWEKWEYWRMRKTGGRGLFERERRKAERGGWEE